MAYCQVRRAMAQREKWLEEQRLVPAMRRECGVKIAAVLVLTSSRSPSSRLASFSAGARSRT